MERMHNLSIERLTQELERMEKEARSNNALEYFKAIKRAHYQKNYREAYLDILFPKLDSATSNFDWSRSIDLYIFNLLMLSVLGFKKINCIKHSDDYWFGIDQVQKIDGSEVFTRCFTDSEKLEPRYSVSNGGKDNSIRCLIEHPNYVFYKTYHSESESGTIQNDEILVPNLDLDLIPLIHQTASTGFEWDYDVETIERIKQEFYLNDSTLVPSVLYQKEKGKSYTKTI